MFPQVNSLVIITRCEGQNYKVKNDVTLDKSCQSYLGPLLALVTETGNSFILIMSCLFQKAFPPASGNERLLIPGWGTLWRSVRLLRTWNIRILDSYFRQTTADLRHRDPHDLGLHRDHFLIENLKNNLEYDLNLNLQKRFAWIRPNF